MDDLTPPQRSGDQLVVDSLCRIEKIQDGVSAEDNVVIITKYDLKDHTVRKVDTGDGNDESEEDSGVVYHNNEEYVDTD